MSFQKTTILSTREVAVGPRFLGQTVPVPNGRLDKVSLYLEPEFVDALAAESVEVTVRVFAVDGTGIPTGAPLAEDMKLLSDMSRRGDYNFRIEAYVPTTVAVVLIAEGSTLEQLVSWRYVSSEDNGQPMLISENSGSTWAKVSDRKFAYKAFSLIQDAVSLDEQDATIQAGTEATITDDTNAEWQLATLSQAKIDPPSGSTVIIDFGNFLVTLVVDQSGSMTWNDRDGLRFTFLKDYIDDLEASLSGTGSTAAYSIVKFRSRQIGSMSFAVQGGEDFLTEFEGVKLIRTPVNGLLPLAGAPTAPGDGIEVFSGFAQEKVDSNLAAGEYWYAIFAYAQDASDNSQTKFSLVSRDRILPVARPKPPIGVAGFVAEEESIDDPVSGLDVGYRWVTLNWDNPPSPDYSEILLVRRTDHFPESPTEPGNVLLLGDPYLNTWEPSTTTSFDDFFPAMDAINGLTYFYRIWTRKPNADPQNPELKCYLSNARTAFVKISTVDRVWEKADPPFNIPPLAFDPNAPITPPILSVQVSVGSKAVKIAWTPWDVDAVRYKVYYNETKYPDPLSTDNGETTYDGALVYDGDGIDASADPGTLQFIHRELTNGEPHFYAFVAVDRVNNHSGALFFTARPSSDPTVDPILPEPVSVFSAECVNSTSVRTTWSTPSLFGAPPQLYFGDTARFLASVTFNDAESSTTSADFEVIEIDRHVTIFDSSEAGPEDLVVFAAAPTNDTTSLSGTVSMIDSTAALNDVASATLTAASALRVVNRTSGSLIKEVRSSQISVRFDNPLAVQVTSDQMVNRRSWDPGNCTSIDTGGTQPHYEAVSIPGVYAGTGDFFQARIDILFRGLALDEDTDLLVRILDKDTGSPAPGINLPQANTDGFSTIRTQPIEEENIDRSGQPTGESTDKTVALITIPPQNVPGDYVLEITATIEGYSRVVTFDFVVEPTLNVDVDALAFRPDNFDRAEQKAFIYVGPFDDETKKIPVPDNTVAEWSLRLVEGNGKAISSRSIYADPPQVPGTGVRAYTHDGITRGIFFGPGGGVEPAKNAICTNGELWELTVDVKYNGMIGQGKALVEIGAPSEYQSLNRIFLRVADGQQGASSEELADNATDGAIAHHTIFCDGVMESEWEVIGDPQNDINRGSDPAQDSKSGVYFYNGVVGSEGINPGGISPTLQVGQAVTMYASRFHGNVDLSNVIITTNKEEKAGSATALVERDTVDNLLKAKFRVRVLARAVGETLTPPDSTQSPSNPVYQSEELFWEKAAAIVGLSVFTIITADGEAFVFGGGGSNLAGSTPPAYISLVEPLGCPSSISES